MFETISILENVTNENELIETFLANIIKGNKMKCDHIRKKVKRRENL